MQAVIDLSKDFVETNFRLFVDKLLSLPEVFCIKIRELEIYRDYKTEMIKSAVDKSYHDGYSDIDLCAIVRLPAKINPRRMTI